MVRMISVLSYRASLGNAGAVEHPSLGGERYRTDGVKDEWAAREEVGSSLRLE